MDRTDGMKKLLSFSSKETRDLITQYMASKSKDACITQSRIFEDAMLLYIANDSLAAEEVRTEAGKIWLRRSQSVSYVKIPPSQK